MTTIAEAYKRWRHTRGYGVHSPFTYALVKGVVRPGRGYAWYGEREVKRASRGSILPGVYDEARMLLRLASFLDVAKAFIPALPDSAPFLAALRAANSRMAITSALAELQQCDLLCATRDIVDIEAISGFLDEPGKCVAIRAYPNGWDRRIFDSLNCGMMLYSRTNLIVISRPEMQKIAYSINL